MLCSKEKEPETDLDFGKCTAQHSLAGQGQREMTFSASRTLQLKRAIGLAVTEKVKMGRLSVSAQRGLGVCVEGCLRDTYVLGRHGGSP